MNMIAMKSRILTQRVMSVKSILSGKGTRGLCYPPALEVTPAIRAKNVGTAVMLLAGVGGMYYAAMAAMQEETEDIEIMRKSLAAKKE